MSDPPPKPLSLRERIAQFEKSSTSAPTPAPAPHVPKKLGQWKPPNAAVAAPTTPPAPSSSVRSAVSPPPASAASDAPAAPRAAAGGMMSASDAQESIRAGGGSLKERMAMLRGSGGFSGPGGSEKPKSPPPKPVAKPKPVVAAPKPAATPEPSSSIGEGETDVRSEGVKSPSPPVDTAADPSDESRAVPESTESQEAEAEEPAEDDAEEEERKRRAAIAARMARLGGARFGMGAPPAFGSRPSATSAEKKETTDNVDEGSAPLLDAPSPPSRSVSPNVPPAMPMPAAPKRAGPPRRKVPAKSDSTKTEDEASTTGDKAEASEIQQIPEVLEPSDAKPQVEEVEETEEDEAVRKKRVAEKMAQMGGVNPLAPRPEIPTPSASMQEGPMSAQKEPEPGYEAGEESEAEKATQEDEVMTPPEPLASHAPIKEMDNEALLMSPPPHRSPPPLNRGTTEEERAYEEGGYEDEDEGEAPHLARSNPKVSHDRDNVEVSSVLPEKREEPPREAAPTPPRSPISEDDPQSGPPPQQPPSPPPRRESLDVPSSRRSSVQGPVNEAISPVEDEAEAVPPPPHRRTSVDVSSRRSSVQLPAQVSSPPAHDDDDKPAAPLPPARKASMDSPASRRGSVQIPARTSTPQVAENVEEERDAPPSPSLEVHEDTFTDEEEPAPPPPPRRTSVDASAPPSRRVSTQSSPPIEKEESGPPPPPRRMSVEKGQPPSRRASAQLSSPVEEQEDEDEDEDPAPPPPPPARVSSPPTRLPPPRIVPPTLEDDEEFVPTQRTPDEEPTKMIRPRYAVQKGGLDAPPPSAIERADSAASNVTATPDREVLDDDEGDPIDPEVYYQTRQSIDRAATPTEASRIPSPTEEDLAAPTQADEDAEAEVERRQRIAERMAKLGGIRFGVAPQAAPQPVARREVEEEGDVTDGAEPEDEEEEERKRKERIAAKLAKMGGMMPGMMGIPGMARPQPPKSQPEEVQSAEVEIEQDVTEAEEDDTPPPPPPPARATRPPVPVPHDDEDTEDAERDEAPPPPPPARNTRPPAPITTPEQAEEEQEEEEEEEDAPPPPPRRGSVQMPPVPPPGRRESTASTKRKSTSASDVPGSPPPLPPSRHVPPAPPSDNFVMVEEPEQGWEMDFGDTDNIASTLSAPTSAAAAPAAAAPAVHMTEDDLMRVWGRVGVQVCEIATTLYEKSKKAPLPSSSPFVDLVLESVPTASTNGGRYLIAKFTTTNADKDVVAEPMPGDIVHFEPGTMLKGKKGLQSYHQNFDEELEGVVSEYKDGSRKIKAFVRAGSGVVDSASYKLEDLKSGSVSVYRVLEDES